MTDKKIKKGGTQANEEELLIHVLSSFYIQPPLEREHSLVSE